MSEIDEKLHNMMLAHLDGVYCISVRKDADELISQIIGLALSALTPAQPVCRSESTGNEKQQDLAVAGERQPVSEPDWLATRGKIVTARPVANADWIIDQLTHGSIKTWIIRSRIARKP